MVIGLPPVLNFGTDKMKAEVLPEILAYVLKSSSSLSPFSRIATDSEGRR